MFYSFCSKKIYPDDLVVKVFQVETFFSAFLGCASEEMKCWSKSQFQEELKLTIDDCLRDEGGDMPSREFFMQLVEDQLDSLFSYYKRKMEHEPIKSDVIFSSISQYPELLNYFKNEFDSGPSSSGDTKN